MKIPGITRNEEWYDALDSIMLQSLIGLYDEEDDNIIRKIIRKRKLKKLKLL